MKLILSHKYRSIVAIASVVLCVLLSIIMIRSCSHDIHDLGGITKSGRLRVFTDSSSMGFVARGDSVYGFQYEVIKQFANSLGLELQITQQNNINEGIEGLLNGDYDIVANFLPNTSELNEKVLLSTPLFTSRLMLVQRSDSTEKIVQNQMELARDTIYTTYRSFDKLRLRHMANEIADTVYIFEVRHASMEQLVDFVSKGKIKYTVCPEQFRSKFVSKFKGVDISVPLGFTQEYSWAVHPGSKQLLNKLNDFLADFIGSEAYWNLYKKYY